MRIEKVDLRALQVGAILSVSTESGNVYQFVVVDPRKCLCRVQRGRTRGSAKSGDKGERVVSTPIIVGHPVFHEDSRTSQVIRIRVSP